MAFKKGLKFVSDIDPNQLSYKILALFYEDRPEVKRLLTELKRERLDR
jgi:hypothetical protein